MQEGAVGEIGQRIVIGQMRHALLEPPPLAARRSLTKFLADRGNQSLQSPFRM